MPDKTPPAVNLDASKSMELVVMASQAQTAKLKEIMSRIDTISQLDQNAMGNVTDVLNSAKSDGGCGIGCW